MSRVITFIRTIALILSAVILYRVVASAVSIYQMEWYSAHFENYAAGVIYTHIIALQCMYFLRFYGIRYTLMIAGLCGIAIMLAKIYGQPVLVDASQIGLEDSWPDRSSIRGLCFFFAILFIEGMLFNFYKKFTDFIFAYPMNKLCMHIFPRHKGKQIL